MRVIHKIAQPQRCTSTGERQRTFERYIPRWRRTTDSIICCIILGRNLALNCGACFCFLHFMLRKNNRRGAMLAQQQMKTRVFCLWKLGRIKQNMWEPTIWFSFNPFRGGGLPPSGGRIRINVDASKIIASFWRRETLNECDQNITFIPFDPVFSSVPRLNKYTDYKQETRNENKSFTNDIKFTQNSCFKSDYEINFLSG